MSVRYFVATLAAGALIAFTGTGSRAAHDMGQDCYICHTLSATEVVPSTRSITNDRETGTVSGSSEPIRCDYCHTGFQSRFTNVNVSGHPVQIITGITTGVQVPSSVTPPTAKVLDCRDCHQGNTKSGGYVPDLAPMNYGPNGIGTGGYPDHDFLGTMDNTTVGDPPHLGTYPDNVNRTYNKVPTSVANLNTNFDLCFSCHNNSGKTTSTKNIQVDSQAGGHYFKTGSAGTWTFNAGDRIPCSDCHASHASATNKFNFGPDPATFSGAAPTGKTTSRAICLTCHDGYGGTASTVTLRGRAPSARTSTVAEHGGATGGGSTAPCSGCHNAHNPPAGGNNCLDCHRSVGPVGARHQGTDLEFPADGTWNAGAGEDLASVQFSGHKGVSYSAVDNYASKATNECKKCHGLGHPTNSAKVQKADDNTAVYSTGFVYGLSYNTGSQTWSANPASFLDADGDGIIDGNEFCLSCHDGADAADPTGKSNIRIGGVDPPKVYYPQGGGSTGHDRKNGLTYNGTNNPAGQQLCTSCHKYHTSDRPQLFPGNVTFNGTNSRTFSMPTWGGNSNTWQAPKPATSVFPSNAGRIQIGNRFADTAISYADNTSPPSGKGFGTAGSSRTATDGLCDACHRDAGTVTGNTLNRAHTHEGDGSSYGSGNVFRKDCLECHDPHGGGANPNIAMIRERVGRDNTSLNTVAFTARTGSNSFDESESPLPEANADDLCATCHNNPPITHNFRTQGTVANHMQGSDCTQCHAHGDNTASGRYGFPQGDCSACHGSDTRTGAPASGDGGTYHPDANNIIGTRAADNTVHKVHVNYLVKRGVTDTATICATCHKGGGGFEQHPGNPANSRSFKSGTMPDNLFLQVSLSDAYRIPGDNAVSATGYRGRPGTAANNGNGWKTCVTTCHQGASPSWAAKTQITTNTMTFSLIDNAAPANVNVNSTRRQMLEFTLVSNRVVGTDNQVSWGGITVRRTGTGADNAVTAVRIYDDSGSTTGSLDSTDFEIGGGVFVNGIADIRFASEEIVVDNAATYFVGYDIAYSAPAGVTVGARLENVGSFRLNSPDNMNGAFPAASTLTTTQNVAADFVTVTGNSTAADNVLQGATDDLLRFRLRVGRGNVDNQATFTGVTVTLSGSVLPSDIDNVILYKDANANGNWDNTDTPLRSAAPAGQTVDFTGLTELINQTASSYYFVVLKLKPTAEWGQTAGAQLASSAAFTVGGSDQVATEGFPMTSNEAEILDLPDRLTINVASTAPANLFQGGTDDLLRLTASTNPDSVDWTGLVVKYTGTGVPVDNVLDSLYVYKDANGDNTWQLAADTLLGYALPQSGATQSTVTFFGTETITAPSTYFVVYKMKAGATEGRTLGAQIVDNSAVLIAGTADTKTVPGGSSGLATVTALVDTVTVAGDNTVAPNYPLAQGASKDFLRFNLRVTSGFGDNAATFTAAQVTLGGTVSPTDIDNVILYKDANGDNTWQVTDNVVGSAVPLGSQVTIGVPSQAVAAASATPYYFVVVKPKATADWTKTVGARLQDNGAITLGNAADRVTGTFPLASANAQITDVSDRLTMSVDNVAPGTILRGTSGAFLRLTPSLDHDSVTWDNLVVTMTGTNPSADVDNVIVYRDANANNVWEASDNVVGWKAPSGPVVTVTLSPQTLTQGSPSYFVVYHIAPTAAAGDNVAARITDNTAIQIQGVVDTKWLAPSPASSTNALVSLPADTVSAARGDMSPGAMTQGAKAAFLWFTTQVTTFGQDNVAALRSVSVAITGSAAGSVGDVLDNVIVYKDANGNNTWQTTDNVVGYAPSPSGSPVTVTFPADQAVGGTTSPRYFVVLSLKSTADWNRTVGAQIPSEAYYNIVAPDQMGPSAAVSSTIVSIQDNTDRLTLAGVDIASSSIAQGADNAFLRLTPSVDRDSVAWTGLVVTKTGSLPVSEVASVTVYKDANGDNAWQATDNVIGSAVPAGQDNVTVNFGAAQTIGTGSNPSYFVVYSILPTATSPSTVGARLTDNSAVLISGAQDARGLAAAPISSSLAAVQNRIPPGGVTGFEAVPGGGQVLLKWTNPPDADTAGTRVLYRLDPFPVPTGPNDITFLIDKTGSANAADNTTHAGAINNIDYYYAAMAYDAAGNFSDNVSYAQATPRANWYLRRAPATDPVTGYLMDHVLPTAATPQSVSVNSKKTGDLPIGSSWVGANPMNLTSLPAGTWTFNVYGYKSNPSQQGRWKVKVYTRVAGSDTLLFESTDNVTIPSASSLRSWTYIDVAHPSISPNAKLLVEFYVYVPVRVQGKYYLEYDGASEASNFLPSFTYVAPAPARETGGGTPIACNSCHQFGPVDNAATLAGGGYIDNGNLQYYVQDRGSHPAHGMTNFGANPANPVGTDAANACTICHLPETGTPSLFGYDHASGALDLRSTGLGSRTANPSYSDNGTYNDNTRTCSSTYCHAGVATPAGGPNGSWGYGTTSGLCNACHAYNLTPAVPRTAAHARHDNTAHHNGASSTSPTRAANAGGYSFSCSYCHFGTGHVNYPVSSRQAAEVIFGGTLGGANIGSGASYAAGAAVSGTEGGKLNYTSGSCTVYCHSNASPFGGTNVYDNVSWGGTVTCGLSCHGGNKASASPIASGSHARHVSGSNLSCGRCHSGTVGTSSDTAITSYDNHVNGYKNVKFSPDVGGSAYFDNLAKRCSSTYCHGTGWSPVWGSGPIASCSACHQSQGAGGGARTFTGAHRAHMDNSSTQQYLFACEVCHAWNASSVPEGTHAGGDNNASGPRTVQVLFTDNGTAGWVYGGAGWTFDSANLWSSPYGAAAPSPSYADNAGTAGTDSMNASITWSAGTCGNVWCHSNAYPASAGGGADTYRAPAWTPGAVACTACHLGADTGSNMQAAPDRMSDGHSWHVATDTYRYTCDECHANTVAADCTVKILDPVGFSYHVNGNKRDIRGAATVLQSPVVNTSLTYDNATRSCSGTNNYCHSDGKRQASPFTARDNTFLWTWNAVPSYGCGSANKCHASNLGTASVNFTTAGDNTAHLKHAYGCGACHYTTQSSPYGTGNGDALHVNGVKDLTFNNQGSNIYDNDANPNNNYDLPTKTCSGITCHGGNTVSWTDNTLSCDSCHTTRNGVPVAAPAYNFTYTAGTPDMSTVSPSYYSTRGHGRNGALPWGAGKNPAALFGRTMVCLDCHDKNVVHNVSTNFFRFRATINGRAVTFDNVDTVCYACHDSAAVKEHSKAVTGGGTSGWDHAQKCVDCHDVHGQANIYMVYDNIVYQDNTAAAYATSNAYGVPYYPASRATVVFSANAVGSDYANSIVQPAGPYTGVCEVCHERTAQFQRSTANGKAGPQGHYTDKCVDCHTHGGGFKGTGCSECHGSKAASTYWPDNTATTSRTGYPDRSGQHLVHVKRIGERKGYGPTPASYTGTQQRDICSFCHDDLDSGLGGVGPSGHYATGYTDNNAPADVRNMKYLWSPYGGDPNDAYNAATYDGSKNFTGGSTCSAVDCHYNVLTPAWYAPATVNCSLCHSSTGTSGSGEPWANAGAHGAHDNAYTISAGVNDASKCADCHAGYVPSSIDCVATMGTHIDNNRYQVKVPDNVGAHLSKGAVNTSFSPSSASGRCSNVSCHGGIQTPSWDNAGSINVNLDSGCRTCHVVDAKASWAAASQYNAAWSGLHGRTGSVSGENHTSADNSAGDRTDSSLCTHCHGLPTLHYAGLDNTATDPVDNFVLTWNGTGGSLSASGCAVTCHSDSDGTTSRWLRRWSSTVDNTGGAECANCHGLFGAWVGGVTHRDDANMRNMHGGKTASPDYGCNECHGWNSLQYDFIPKWDNNGGLASHHGDERIQLNDNASGVARNGFGLTGCSGCHNDYDGASSPQHSFTTVNRWAFVTITDGPFSGACNDCHSYPNMAGGQYAKAMSAVHAKHVGTPSGVAGSKAYLCAVCHFGAYPGYHNQSQVFAGDPWPAGYKDNVSVQFDPSLNPANGGGTLPTYGGVLATGQYAPGDNSGVGTCAGLYCHGGNGTLNVGWGGIDNTPRWDNTVPIACGDCHKADSTLAQGNHPAHLASAFGPVMGNTCSGAGGCHTVYALNNTTKHADGKATLQTAPASGLPADNLAVSAICDNCHTTYTSARVPTSGTDLGKAQWDNTSYKVPCITCHNGGSGAQAYANLNGTGRRAAAIEGTYYAKGHGDNTLGGILPLSCGWCHGPGDGHIGANRPVGTNPWRLSNISNYSLRGRVDQYCANAVCHTHGGDDHWWRVDPDPGVSSDNTRGATDTHPTTTPAVPTSPIDKSRWFQVPLDANIPLQGNLTDNAYNKSGGASNHIVCVSCHDPHGVGTSPIPTRTFSGANTDNGVTGRKMLRYDFSGQGDGSTPLCAKCHK